MTCRTCLQDSLDAASLPTPRTLHTTPAPNFASSSRTRTSPLGSRPTCSIHQTGLIHVSFAVWQVQWTRLPDLNVLRTSRVEIDLHRVTHIILWPLTSLIRSITITHSVYNEIPNGRIRMHDETANDGLEGRGKIRGKSLVGGVHVGEIGDEVVSVRRWWNRGSIFVVVTICSA